MSYISNVDSEQCSPQMILSISILNPASQENPWSSAGRAEWAGVGRGLLGEAVPAAAAPRAAHPRARPHLPHRPPRRTRQQ